MAALVIALPQEAEGIQGYPIYLSGCGKVNAAIATMKAIRDGHNFIINFGSAGTVSDVSGLVEVTGYVDRDMDARALQCDLGQTPFEDGIIIGEHGIVCGSGDKFATSKPEIACDIVDMEAYAIAHVCKQMNVQFTCYKYITDYVGTPHQADTWQANVANGVEEILKAL